MTPYEIITLKRDGHELSAENIQTMVNGFTDGSIPDYQMAAWLMAVFFRGMSDAEKHALTQAMLHSGEVVDLSEIPGIKVDKHSTGGVGDKVSIPLAAIVAAAGVPVPMISGRGLGHTGGTLDKLESIPGFRVDYEVDDYKKIIAETGVCLIGQTATIAPADKKMYALRDVTATVQSIPLISGSIMSKKLAEGIDALVLDVKTGHGAFMQKYEDSVALAKSLIGIGENGGKQTVAFITNMNQPLGHAVGNWLEIEESLLCLQGKGPDDLMQVTHHLCGAMIWLGKKAASLSDGIEISKKMVKSGKAMEKFIEIVKRQQGDVEMIRHPEKYPVSKYHREVPAARNGVISDINSLEVGLSAVQLGAGRLKSDDKIDPKAGIMVHKKIGDRVSDGDPLMTVYTDKPEALDAVVARLKAAVTIGDAPVEPPKMILEFLDKDSLD